MGSEAKMPPDRKFPRAAPCDAGAPPALIEGGEKMKRAPEIPVHSPRRTATVKRTAWLLMCFTIAVAGFVRAGQPVYIPDPNLKCWIDARVGLNATPTDMLKLKHIDQDMMSLITGCWHPIDDLTGLEYAKNLERLVLYPGHIKDLSPLAGLTKLTQLSLDHHLI